MVENIGRRQVKRLAMETSIIPIYPPKATLPPRTVQFQIRNIDRQKGGRLPTPLGHAKEHFKTDFESLRHLNW